MKKYYLIYIFVLTSICFTIAKEEKNLELGKIELSVSIPLNIPKKILNNYKNILEERIKFILEDKIDYSISDEVLLLNINKENLSTEKLFLLKNALTRNIYVDFYEVLNKFVINNNCSYINYINFGNKEEAVLVNDKKITFSREDFSKIEIVPPSNKGSDVAKTGFMVFTIKKENPALKIFMEDLFKKNRPGACRVFASCSGLLSTAPTVHAPLDYEFSIPFHEGKEFKNRLIEMQIRYPLPFEILNY